MRLVYLSPVSWLSFSQRPHELIRYFHACTGGEVLWVDPYPTRLPSFSDISRGNLVSESAGEANPHWLTVIRPQALPIEPLPFSGTVNQLLWRNTLVAIKRFANGQTALGIGKPSALALQLLATHQFKFSFYDAMDDFPAFYRGLSQFAMARRERSVVRAVSTVVASSTNLYARLKIAARDVRLALNACAVDRLPPFSIKKHNENPVVGYVGTIANWFDWDLVNALALAQPSIRLRLIGPLHARPLLTLAPNIFLEPPLPHAQALRAMAEFDIGLIPFKRTELTASVDPIKYYEYRALGLPVISTAFGEMAMRENAEGVYLIHQLNDCAGAIEQALNLPVSVAGVAQFRLQNSWSNRFAETALFRE